MAGRAAAIFSLGFAMAAVLARLGEAQSGAGCLGSIISMSPCLGYISGNTSVPTSSCCSALSGVLQSQPRCLCAVLNGGASSLGIKINTTHALELPGACKVQTPPVSDCNAANSPTEAPLPAPAAAPTPLTSGTSAKPSTASVSTPPAGGGSKTTEPGKAAAASAGNNVSAGKGSKGALISGLALLVLSLVVP